MSPMFAAFVWSAVVASRAEIPASLLVPLTQVGTVVVQVTPSPQIIPGEFVRVHRVWGRDLKQRFQVQVPDGNVLEFEFATTGLVTRNGEPARLIDLQPGDRVFLYRNDPSSTTIVRVDAAARQR